LLIVLLFFQVGTRSHFLHITLSNNFSFLVMPAAFLVRLASSFLAHTHHLSCSASGIWNAFSAHAHAIIASLPEVTFAPC